MIIRVWVGGNSTPYPTNAADLAWAHYEKSAKDHGWGVCKIEFEGQNPRSLSDLEGAIVAAEKKAQAYLNERSGS